MLRIKKHAGNWIVNFILLSAILPATSFAQPIRTIGNLSTTEVKLDTPLMLASRLINAGAGAIPKELLINIQSFVDENVATDQTIFVVIKALPTPDLINTLRVIGGSEITEYPRFETITARIPIAAIDGLASRSDVRSIGAREEAETNRYFPTDEEMKTKFKHLVDGAIGNAGSVNWEGVVAHKAGQAISAGNTGAGVKVCVISDGVNTLASRQATGDLGTVTVVPGQAGSGDEGTAMLEIVHDVAPGASLYFATALSSVAAMASNILTLRNTYACDIIVDDVSYFNEGAFQDGPIAQAVNTVTSAGAIYFSSAANSGNLTKGTSGTFEGDFVDGGAVSGPIANLGETGSFHLFGSLPYTTLTKATSRVSLKWSDPLAASTNDYNLFVVNAAGTAVLGYSASVQNGIQDPFEFASCNLCTFPVGARLYIVKHSGAARALRIDTHRGAISNGTAGSTYGHNAAASAISVAAVNVGTAAGSVFVGGASNPVQTYSSDGPRKIFYTPAGAAVTPGNVLFGTNGGTTLAKVDLAASDCGSTTTPGFIPFCGTSAAAPTAAALAALIKGANPSFTGAQVLSALKGTALDIEGGGTDRDSGVGIVMTPASLIGGGGSTFALSVSKVGTGTGSVLSAPGGISCGSSCSSSFSSGTSVTLTATADSNSVFAGWSGSGCSGLGTCTVTMSTARSVFATFNLKSAPVTPLSLTGLGGAIESEQHFQVQVPGGATDLQISISGGTGDADLYVKYAAAASTSNWDCRPYLDGNDETCAYSIPATGTWHIMIRGYSYGTGFSGVTLTVTYRASGTTYTLSVSKAGAGSGTVSSSPVGVSCGVDCQEPFASGSTVTLTATPASGSKFTGWSGGCTGSGPCTLSMSAAKSVTATFGKSVSITPILQLLLD